MRLIWIVALATIVNASLPKMFGGRPRGGFMGHLYQNMSIAVDDPNIGTDWVTQKLDHFDSKNAQTWRQKYYYNLNSGKADSGVNFLLLSGEFAAPQTLVTKFSPLDYAKALNAPIYALEHRYYGESHPTTDMSTVNLKYLSSQQAIEDAAEFIRQKNAEKGGVQKWIVAGGSYAGNLAAWARLLHPDLIVGALASSAPVFSQLDFYGYLQVVEDGVRKESDTCADLIKSSFDEVVRLMQSSSGRTKVTQGFGINPPLKDDISENDMHTFYLAIMDPFMSAAQYTMPPMADICQVYSTYKDDPIKALQNISYINGAIDFNADLAALSDVTYGKLDRPWMYQTCAEFGYFTSTDRGTNIFGQVASTRISLEYCIKLFGIYPDDVQKNVDASNDYYGGRDYFTGTNVVFTHGTQDPWSFLAKKSDPAHWSVVIAEIANGDHISDLKSCQPGPCNDNMKQVQTITLENMKTWLAPMFPVPDSVAITDNVGARPTSYDGNMPISHATKTREAVVPRSRRAEVEQAQNVHRPYNTFTGRRRERHSQAMITSAGEAFGEDGISGQDWFEQPWDHFDPAETRTFNLRYYYNYEFALNVTEGPNFLMIGGEGPVSSYYESHYDVPFLAWAKEVGANAFTLEHRYYGQSKLGTNDLQYLTSTQSLYDVAAFIQFQQTNNSRTGPWIVFGGSYPGALAMWTRQWFPELIVGAVGSSATALVKNDFFEYMEVIDDVLKRQSPKCRDRINQAFEQFRQLTLSPDGRKKIQDKFQLVPAWTGDENETIDPLDLNTVFSNIMETFTGTVQYNDVQWNDVKAVCAPFEDDSKDPLDALRAAQELEFGDDSGNPVTTGSSFDSDVAYYKSLMNSVDGKDGKFSDNQLSDILYMWQMCNEFGKWQTTDNGGEGIFGSPLPLNYFVVMCERLFDFGMEHTESGVAQINYYHGAKTRYEATNVVLPAGDADPWHPLDITEKLPNLDDTVVPILIKGTSHCVDMHAPTPNDPPELTAARATILENIKKWIAPYPAKPTVQPPRTTTTPGTTTTSAAASIFSAALLAIVCLVI